VFMSPNDELRMRSPSLVVEYNQGRIAAVEEKLLQMQYLEERRSGFRSFQQVWIPFDEIGCLFLFRPGNHSRVPCTESWYTLKMPHIVNGALVLDGHGRPIPYSIGGLKVADDEYIVLHDPITAPLESPMEMAVLRRDIIMDVMGVVPCLREKILEDEGDDGIVFLM